MHSPSHPTLWLVPLLTALILWLLATAVLAGRLRVLYERYFKERRRERLFLAALAFFITLAVVRIIAFMIHVGIGPFHDIWMRGRHIHHLVWGILLSLFVGYSWLVAPGVNTAGSNNSTGRVVSLIYGFAAALTLDEFALWLNLRDVYWDREGRASIEAVLLFGALLSIGVYGANFFRAIFRQVFGASRH